MMHKFRPLYWIVILVVKIFTRITCRIDAPDLHKVPMQGPLILIANHTGQIEVPLLFAHLQPRPLTGWAKVETWDNWFLHWVFDLWGAIPIHRGEADMKALRLALQALKNEAILAIAPEGTRNKTGRLLRAMPGAVIIALHSGVPIQPIAHWGGEDFLKNLKHLKRTDFHIRVGEPFTLDLGAARISAAMRQQIVDEMMYQLAALLPEEYRGEYADPDKPTKNYIKPVNSLPPLQNRKLRSAHSRIE